MNDLVIINNGQAVVSSRQIAEHFGKRHDHVMRDIEAIQEDVPNFGEMFINSTMPDSYGRDQKVYLMNRDGFTLLAMGFTGRKALEWKLKYIQAFNAMEQKMKFNLPQTYVEALKALVVKVEEAERLQLENAQKSQIINELQPKATYYDLVLQNKSLLSISKIAKDYGMSGTALNTLLHELGIQFKQGGVWLLYQKYADKGYTQSKTHVIDDEKNKFHTYWTQKGRLFIYELLKSKKGILPLIEIEFKEQA